MLINGEYTNVNAANKYARDVVSGRIDACKEVKQACKRHLDDLKKSETRAFKYKFCRDTAEKACDFVQLLPHTKGKWARERELITLEPWQKFIFSCVFGWVYKKTGFRRFTEAYCEIPRKNGKSVIAAGVGLYMLCADGEYSAKVYCVATTQKQALEFLRPAKLMLERAPDLTKFHGVKIMAKKISIPADGSSLEPLFAKPGDDSPPSCAIIEEYHELKEPDQYETMLTGMSSREQGLMFIITTLGFNLAGPCYDKRSQVQQMLDGVMPNEEMFGIIYGIDVGDDWKDPAVLKKSNPNFGVSVSPEYLLDQQSEAIQYPSKANLFLTKHLNVLVSAKSA